MYRRHAVKLYNVVYYINKRRFGDLHTPSSGTVHKIIQLYFIVSVFGWPDPNTRECCES